MGLAYRTTASCVSILFVISLLLVAWLGDGNDDCRGLEPDIPVERTNQSMPGSEADEQLNFSIALLQEKLALGIQINNSPISAAKRLPPELARAGRDGEHR
jgi:hypothetical protein